MNIRHLAVVLILLALMLAGCTDQQQKDTPEPSGSNGQFTATPQETENATSEQPEGFVSDVDNLESNISEVENLIKDLEETDEINFNI